METATQNITVETKVNAPVGKVWQYFTAPEHVTKWNHASDDWHSPHAENDLRVDGNFKFTMAAKDGSFSFDFAGVYSQVKLHEQISYTMGDGRKVDVRFSDSENQTTVTETFETENTHSVEMQRGGWQAILDNFKKYVELN